MMGSFTCLLISLLPLLVQGHYQPSYSYQPTKIYHQKLVYSHKPVYHYEPQEPTYGYELTCSTVSGPDPYLPCVFPFKHNGVQYNTCGEWVWGGGNNGKQWCSTQTDNYGNHIEGHGYYGFCSSSCPSSYNSYNRRSW